MCPAGDHCDNLGSGRRELAASKFRVLCRRTRSAGSGCRHQPSTPDPWPCRSSMPFRRPEPWALTLVCITATLVTVAAASATVRPQRLRTQPLRRTTAQGHAHRSRQTCQSTARGLWLSLVSPLDCSQLRGGQGLESSDDAATTGSASIGSEMRFRPLSFGSGWSRPSNNRLDLWRLEMR